jgi:hypothetical protein
MSGHEVALRVIACVLGAGMFIAGLIGAVKQGFWNQ